MVTHYGFVNQGKSRCYLFEFSDSYKILGKSNTGANLCQGIEGLREKHHVAGDVFKNKCYLLYTRIFPVNLNTF